MNITYIGRLSRTMHKNFENICLTCRLTWTILLADDSFPPPMKGNAMTSKQKRRIGSVTSKLLGFAARVDDVKAALPGGKTKHLLRMSHTSIVLAYDLLIEALDESDAKAQGK